MSGGRQLEEVKLKCIERTRKTLLVTKSQLRNSGERAPTALTGLARLLQTQLKMSKINVQQAVQRKCPWSYLTSASLKQTKNTRQADSVLKNKDKEKCLPGCKAVWRTRLSKWQRYEKNAFFTLGIRIWSWNSTYNLRSSTQGEVLLCTALYDHDLLKHS